MFTEFDDPEHFKLLCDMDLARYPRSPVVVERQTAKDIDLSGIFRMTPEQIDEALQALEAA